MGAPEEVERLKKEKAAIEIVMNQVRPAPDPAQPDQPHPPDTPHATHPPVDGGTAGPLTRAPRPAVGGAGGGAAAGCRSRCRLPERRAVKAFSCAPEYFISDSSY